MRALFYRESTGDFVRTSTSEPDQSYALVESGGLSDAC